MPRLEAGAPLTLEAQRRRLNLRLTALVLGQDLCVTLSGGDRPHIGAVAVAQGNAAATVVSLPGHREDALARRLAQELATEIQATVCLACGIHLDNIRPEEIRDALELAESLVQLLRSHLRDGHPAPKEKDASGPNTSAHPPDKALNPSSRHP